MMNDKKRQVKLIVAIMLGVISLGITSLSFSYAWYASSSRVEVSGVDIYIRSERNLRLSQTIDGDYQNDLVHHQDEFGMFDPCSSMFQSTWYDEKAMEPVFYKYNNPLIEANGTPKPIIASHGLYSQTLFLKVDDDAYITLDKEMIKLDVNEKLNAQKAKLLASQNPEYSEEQYLERLNSLKKCLRMSILIPDEDYRYFIIDPYKEGETYFGGRLDLEKTGYYSYHSMSDGLQYETVFGEIKNRDKIVYDEASPTDGQRVGELTSFNSATKADVKPFNLEKSLANGIEIAKEESITLDEVEEEIVIPMYHEKPKRVVVSIYMEGWDLDCTNAHMGSNFDLGVAFKIIREM